MRSTRSRVREREAVARWDVARPPRPSRTAGVSLAGFRDRNAGPVDMRVVPHPAVTLVLDFGDGPLVVDTATGRQQLTSLVAGFTHGPLHVRGESIECVEVRLSPLVAYAVLGTSPAELEHEVVSLDDLWGRGASRIREQLGEARSWQDRFALTDALLARRAETGPSVDPQVAWSWDRIVGSRGRVRIDELAAEVGWSRKRLWSRFRAQIGLPPKRAARLVRFDHAVHRLAAGEDVARIAADSGYVDQSHLHRDVLKFTGMTPATAAREPGLAVDDIAWADTASARRTDTPPHAVRTARHGRGDGVHPVERDPRSPH
ncbi:helix-turn-helix domain-containing protein [Streptomyces sp. CB03238]|uniref:helix-turn-helix domain-containing protein n=1 Tax=Streptomyces sp. CB03238 TaxID=1907777 RepID=UPI000A118F66|nr:helix-turn-helix domain-containing protein [Streptomyces sp. CB03238]ORT60341.1 AraC family transcriptional regulator [Streptomyces sp. CB03238]